MECKSNQLVVEKVENGFILTIQEKSSSSLFGNNQTDKKHYVAESEKTLLTLLGSKVKNMVSSSDLEKEVEEDE